MDTLTASENLTAMIFNSGGDETMVSNCALQKQLEDVDGGRKEIALDGRKAHFQHYDTIPLWAR